MHSHAIPSMPSVQFQHGVAVRINNDVRNYYGRNDGRDNNESATNTHNIPRTHVHSRA